jgi:hypothetical protein
MVTYPKTWQSIRFPELRSSLILYLHDLAGVGSQNLSDPYAIDDVYHFFFDDTDLVNAHDCIGLILFNSDEAEVVSKITEVLESLLIELGDTNTFAYTKHPQWQIITNLAASGLILFEALGVPSFFNQ